MARLITTSSCGRWVLLTTGIGGRCGGRGGRTGCGKLAREVGAGHRGGWGSEDGAGSTRPPHLLMAALPQSILLAPPLLPQFGCQWIEPDLVARVQRVTGRPAHPFLKRGIFFAHR